MKIIIFAIVGAPVKEIRIGGPNPWIFQRKFELELIPEILTSLLQYGNFKIPYRCFLRFPRGCDGNFVGISLVKYKPEFHMYGSLLDREDETIKRMLKEDWEPLITQEENMRYYNLDIPNLPQTTPKLIWNIS